MKDFGFEAAGFALVAELSETLTDDVVKAATGFSSIRAEPKSK